MWLRIASPSIFGIEASGIGTAAAGAAAAGRLRQPGSTAASATSATSRTSRLMGALYRAMELSTQEACP